LAAAIGLAFAALAPERRASALAKQNAKRL
jgi:hypothetical protein